MDTPPRAEGLPDHVRVAVVGAGFAGIGAAAGLARAGYRDVLVLERADAVGGVWRDNSYPGCACDVPSHLYSFSFAPHPGWTRSFSGQPEIEAYLADVVRRLGLAPQLRLGTELERADWDGSRWRLRTNRGQLTADVLVLGTGALSEPSVPHLPGLPTFAGPAFHSARWDHSVELAGRRVAVVGTGASAVQFVPEIAPAAGGVTVFQRTPPWVLPRRDRPIPAWKRALFARLPAAQRATRLGIYLLRESWVLGFTHPRLMRRPEAMARAFLAAQVPDPVLRAKLEPDYRLGCKRVLLSSTWYRTLTRPDVSVVTDPVVEVRPEAVVTRAADGALSAHPADVLVFGTGFRVTDPPVAERVHGRDGAPLAQVWGRGGAQALHGTTVAGFPNLFVLMGPNTGLGHTSVLLVIEAQVRYLLDALARMDREGRRSVEPTPAAQEAHNADLQRRLAGTVWNAGGCRSWYLDPRSGRNTTLWPTTTLSLRRRLRSLDPSEYLLS